MGFARVDGYLLGEPISKVDAVAELLRERSELPAAAPFYRALDAVRERAADEALIALRLVLAGRAPDDAAVRRLRALCGIARASANGDRAAVAKLLERDAAAIADLGSADPATIGALARAAYVRELRAPGSGEPA